MMCDNSCNGNASNRKLPLYSEESTVSSAMAQQQTSGTAKKRSRLECVVHARKISEQKSHKKWARKKGGKRSEREKNRIVGESVSVRVLFVLARNKYVANVCFWGSVDCIKRPLQTQTNRNHHHHHHRDKTRCCHPPTIIAIEMCVRDCVCIRRNDSNKNEKKIGNCARRRRTDEQKTSSVLWCNAVFPCFLSFWTIRVSRTGKKTSHFPLLTTKWNDPIRTMHSTGVWHQTTAHFHRPPSSLQSASLTISHLHFYFISLASFLYRWTLVCRTVNRCDDSFVLQREQTESVHVSAVIFEMTECEAHIILNVLDVFGTI